MFYISLAIKKAEKLVAMKPVEVKINGYKTTLRMRPLPSGEPGATLNWLDDEGAETVREVLRVEPDPATGSVIFYAA